MMKCEFHHHHLWQLRTFRFWRCFGVVTCLCLTFASLGAGIGWAQDNEDKSRAESNEVKSEANTSAGLESLDRAIQRKLSARSMEELQETIRLCEEALQKGLDEGNAGIAKELLSSTLYEQAKGVSQRLLQGNVPMFQVDESDPAGKRVVPDPRFVRPLQFAVAALERAITYNKEHGESHLLLARLLARVGGHEKGKKAAEEAVRLLKEDDLLLSKALVLRGAYAEDNEKRLLDYNEAIRLDKRNLDAWRARGLLRVRSGNVEGAIDDFLTLLELAPNDLQGLQTAAQLLFSQEKLDQAVEMVTKAIELNPNGTATYTLRAAIHAKKEDFQSAIADLDRAIQNNSGNVSALMMRARIRQQQKKYDPALSDINRVMSLIPEQSQEALLMRSLLLAEMDRLSEAIDDMQQLVRMNPDSVRLQLQLAALYQQNEQPRRSIQVYTNVLDKDRDNWRALLGRGNARLSVGNHPDAIMDYEASLELNPDESGQSSILNNLAWVLSTSPMDELRDSKRAIEIATKACEITDFKAAHILSTLAAGYAEDGDFETAIKWSGRAVSQAKEGLGEEGIDDDVRKSLEEQLKQLQQELESYRQRKPWRELVETEEKDAPE